MAWPELSPGGAMQFNGVMDAETRRKLQLLAGMPAATAANYGVTGGPLPARPGAVPAPVAPSQATASGGGFGAFGGFGQDMAGALQKASAQVAEEGPPDPTPDQQPRIFNGPTELGKESDWDRMRAIELMGQRVGGPQLGVEIGFDQGKEQRQRRMNEPAQQRASEFIRTMMGQDLQNKGYAESQRVQGESAMERQKSEEAAAMDRERMKTQAQTDLELKKLRSAPALQGVEKGIMTPEQAQERIDELSGVTPEKKKIPQSITADQITKSVAPGGGRAAQLLKQINDPWFQGDPAALATDLKLTPDEIRALMTDVEDRLQLSKLPPGEYGGLKLSRGTGFSGNMLLPVERTTSLEGPGFKIGRGVHQGIGRGFAGSVMGGIGGDPVADRAYLERVAPIIMALMKNRQGQ